MIESKTISDLNYTSDEGKMLFAAIAILTSIDHDDINKNRYGGMTHPDDIVKRITDLTNRIYYEKEYTNWKKSEDRDNKIKTILL